MVVVCPGQGSRVRCEGGREGGPRPGEGRGFGDAGYLAAGVQVSFTCFALDSTCNCAPLGVTWGEKARATRCGNPTPGASRIQQQLASEQLQGLFQIRS